MTRFMRFCCTGMVLGLALMAGMACAGPETSREEPETSGEEWRDRMTRYQKPSDEELRRSLSREQYEVTQKEATERPFQNEYWDNHEAGIYVDVVSGEPLFSSLDKFESGTGWPSFTRPLEAGNIATHEDRKLLSVRNELRSRLAGSHLGHVFDDGPAPTGQRYCINSASLRFIPVDRLEEEGYGEYLPLFGRAPGGTTGSGGSAKSQTAILAGGCFWGMEELIRQMPGVLSTDAGYAGGKLPNATYTDVKRGDTGHAESVRIVFDPAILSYEKLLEWFFRIHDPTTKDRQGNDRGSQYRSAIFYDTEEQRQTAERVKERVDRSGHWKGKVVTEIVAAGDFWRAEDYHQDYLQKNPDGYTCHFVRPWTYSEEDSATPK